jgi:coatomer subunit beta'
MHRFAVHLTQPRFPSCSGPEIKLSNFANGSITLETVFDNQHSQLSDVKFNPMDPNTFATGSRDKDLPIKFWSVNSSKYQFGLEGQTGGMKCIEFRPGSEGSSIASGNADFTITTWNLVAKTCVARLSGYTDSIAALRFHPDSRRLLSTSADGLLLVWNWVTHTMETRIDHKKCRGRCIDSKANQVAVGYDHGFVVMEIGGDSGGVSQMDPRGKPIESVALRKPSDRAASVIRPNSTGEFVNPTRDPKRLLSLSTV